MCHSLALKKKKGQNTVSPSCYGIHGQCAFPCLGISVSCLTLQGTPVLHNVQYSLALASSLPSVSVGGLVPGPPPPVPNSADAQVPFLKWRIL